VVLFICSPAHCNAAISFFVSANFLGLSLVHFLSAKHLNIILSLLISVTIQEHSKRTQKLLESEESNTALSRLMNSKYLVLSTYISREIFPLSIHLSH